jgi:hypothetical protein
MLEALALHVNFELASANGRETNESEVDEK